MNVFRHSTLSPFTRPPFLAHTDICLPPHPHRLPQVSESETSNSSVLIPPCMDGETETQVTQWVGGTAGTRASWFPSSTFLPRPRSQHPSSLDDASLALRASIWRPVCLWSQLGIRRSLLSFESTLWRPQLYEACTCIELILQMRRTRLWRWSNLPQVTHLASGRAKLQTRPVLQCPSACFYSILPILLQHWVRVVSVGT